MADQGTPLEIGRFFEAAVKRGASDVLFTAGVPPCLRRNVQVVAFDLPPLTPDQSRTLVYSVLTTEQIGRFEADFELDFSIEYQDKARFRGNAYLQRGAVAGAFRLIPAVIPSLPHLGLPPVLEEIGRAHV